MDERAAIWERAREHQPERRGFDDDRAWFPALAMSTEGVRARHRPVVTEDLRATLAGIESLAGWWVRTMPCDPVADRDQLLQVAARLEDMACALGEALNDDEEAT
jgi:hypothetical protein